MYEKLIFGSNENNSKQASEVNFRISPFSFFQTNTLGAQQLFSLGMQIAGQVEGNILDLYC
jgi:tRNA/tmRNA/rRNA uracil-C5-methylase (TrmA/RlmC/RlmD family)